MHLKSTWTEAPLRALVVEDDDDTRSLISGRLRQQGWVVVESYSAEEGLELLLREPFQLVAVDYSLPGESGAWMLEQARHADALADIPTLLISGTVTAKSRDGWQLLPKPLDFSALERAADAVTRTRRGGAGHMRDSQGFEILAT